ncbi:MAG TPA: M48 family metalloprotease [Candidatus Saccharimonadales bacterium]|nr:M48 family metalloprotease [Candidatus Saccharimonadales bacterium]
MPARRMVRLFSVLLLFASTCAAQQSATGSHEFSFTQPDVELLDRSNQLDKKFQEKGLVFNDSETTKYLTKVGLSVLPAGAEYQNVHWQFFVLRDPTPNAFALPNGSIYVHTGLLAELTNEAQLAGVLAHEETHVTNRHGYLENRSYRKKAEAGIILAGAASAAGLGIGVGNEVFWIVQLAIPSILASSINGYSRDLEQEADLRAVHALVDTGYSAAEMKSTFDALQQDHEVDLSRKSFYQDHPKLQERSRYVGNLAASIQHDSSNSRVDADQYLIETESAVRQDADLEIRSGRARTAVWEMERIVKRDDKLADNFYVLGEAYRGLGPRTPEPQPEELTNKGKDTTRKQMEKMTPQEYEAALLKAPGAQQTLESNQQLAEKNYRKAIEMSPELAGPHKGLGFMYQQELKPAQSVQEFKKYLELAPSAMDSPQITRRIEALEKGTAGKSQATGAN